jgi:hypothetical protein
VEDVNEWDDGPFAPSPLAAVAATRDKGAKPPTARPAGLVGCGSSATMRAADPARAEQGRTVGGTAPALPRHPAGATRADLPAPRRDSLVPPRSCAG